MTEQDAALNQFTTIVWDFLDLNAQVNAPVLGCPGCTIHMVAFSIFARAAYHDRVNFPNDEAWIEETLSALKEGLTLYAQASNDQQHNPPPTHLGTETPQ